jgi:hypothetical protein
MSVKSKKTKLKSEEDVSLSSSIQSISERTLENVDSRDPLTHLAGFLFYNIHVVNMIHLTRNLASNDHQILEEKMYFSAGILTENAIKTFAESLRSYNEYIKDELRFHDYLELLLSNFAPDNIVRKLRRENYESLLCAILTGSIKSYIRDLKAETNTLFAYDGIKTIKPFCVNFMRTRLITEFERSTHRIVDDSPDTVPRLLYEQVKTDRDKLCKKLVKLQKKYKRLKYS